MIQLQPGDAAPSFELEGIELGRRRLVRLSEFIGQYVVLFFYPYNFSPLCTLQNCEFRDRYDDFQLNSHQLDKVIILGISPDRMDSHRLFSLKNRLPFLLLSDPELLAAQLYGAINEHTKNAVRSGDTLLRKTFIIRPDGHIARCYDVENAREHIGQVIIDLQSEAAKGP
ncbi:peroxiredoxin Q/BCP [Paenibacillus cellulosilyticus]|uniref:thioredoxin-dependent peroxiredoxin n=1 Tax=Paenibacillus cellulosilyticus TaxID=375489 RepID=A0A2V2YY04_9BACL|nr:peroxiredoxin [Paenibacillus cellulosilyticus]PWW03213.1 peroxiredoxin Q/BCP [Paenibacillus cellulosilyticus]QKS43702.1 peroxiredoxin [Paenibacillus cellulosilyticus]